MQVSTISLTFMLKMVWFSRNTIQVFGVVVFCFGAFFSLRAGGVFVLCCFGCCFFNKRHNLALVVKVNYILIY